MDMTIARHIGRRIGLAVAEDTIAEKMPRNWTGIDPQDGDILIQAGIRPGTPEWEDSERTARATFLEALCEIESLKP